MFKHNVYFSFPLVLSQCNIKARKKRRCIAASNYIRNWLESRRGRQLFWTCVSKFRSVLQCNKIWRYSCTRTTFFWDMTWRHWEIYRHPDIQIMFDRNVGNRLPSDEANIVRTGSSTTLPRKPPRSHLTSSCTSLQPILHLCRDISLHAVYSHCCFACLSMLHERSS